MTYFVSDIHGEYEAFLHIRRSASGAIRQKVELLFGKTITSKERSELTTLIYYPKEKLNVNIRPEQRHHESAWAKEFKEFLHLFLNNQYF